MVRWCNRCSLIRCWNSQYSVNLPFFPNHSLVWSNNFFFGSFFSNNWYFSCKDPPFTVGFQIKSKWMKMDRSANWSQRL